MEDFRKYKRFFAFGCSFTNYHWSTWADIIGAEIPEYYNYGNPASGNTYIFSSIVEANIRHKFTKDDLIVVMWSSLDREDRYIDNKWQAKGSVFRSLDNFYDKEFVMKYVDTRGFFIRDATLITATTKMLKGLDYHFLSMVPFNNAEFGDQENIEDYLKVFFEDGLTQVKSSVWETVYSCDWTQHRIVKYLDSKGKEQNDLHPTPMLHLLYLQRTFPEINIKSETIQYLEEQEKIIYSEKYFDRTKYSFTNTRKKHNRL